MMWYYDSLYTVDTQFVCVNLDRDGAVAIEHYKQFVHGWSVKINQEKYHPFHKFKKYWYN